MSSQRVGSQNLNALNSFFYKATTEDDVIRDGEESAYLFDAIERIGHCECLCWLHDGPGLSSLTIACCLAFDPGSRNHLIGKASRFLAQLSSSQSSPLQIFAARACFDALCKTPGFLRYLQGAIGGERVPMESARQIAACLLEFCRANPEYRGDDCIIAIHTFLKFKASSSRGAEGPSQEMLALDMLLATRALENARATDGGSNKGEGDDDGDDADAWGAAQSTLAPTFGTEPIDRVGDDGKKKGKEEDDDDGDVPDCWEDSDDEEEACAAGASADEVAAAERVDALDARNVQRRPLSLQEVWGEGGAPGGRHDNDHQDFRSITLCPSASEVNTDAPPALPRGVLPGEDGLLERQFRLLREDMVSSLKESLKGPPRHPNLVFSQPEYLGVRVLPRPCIMLRVQASTDISRRCHNLREDALQDFFESGSGKKILPIDTFVTLADGQGTVVAVGIVAKRPRAHRTTRGGSNAQGSVRCCLEVGLRFCELDAARLLADVSANGMRNMLGAAVLVQSTVGFFAYEPVLRSLSLMRRLPMNDEVLHQRPTLLSGVPHAGLKVSGMEEGLRKLLEEDVSQKEAVELAMEQRLAILQGPPGTGKTFVGRSIACQILSAAGKPRDACAKGEEEERGKNGEFGCHPEGLSILVLCYTNHALDSFLEGLMDQGVPPEDIVRIGASGKISERLRGRTVQSLIAQQQVEGSGSRQQGQGAGKLKPGLARRIYHLKKELSANDASLCSASGARVADAGGTRLWASMVASEGMAKEADLIKEELQLTVMRGARVIGATTTAAARQRELLRCAGAKVCIVEEAAEILEAHILSSISDEMLHMVMIGDHLQLRPKLQSHHLSVASGLGIDLDKSLFERLATAPSPPYPMSCLAVQHRMRPELSKIIKSTMYPHLLDHASTMDRPHVRGLRADVAFVCHSAWERGENGGARGGQERRGRAHDDDDDDDEDQDEYDINNSNDGSPGAGEGIGMATMSKVNLGEASAVVRIARHLLNSGYSPGQLVILTPYLGQLVAIRESLRTCGVASDVGDMDVAQLAGTGGGVPAESAGETSAMGGLRVATVDNYQGEESDIVIVSLVRSNGRGNIGFLSSRERVNVLLSRARLGMVLVGNKDTLRDASSERGRVLWRKVLGEMQVFDSVDALLA